MKLWNCLLKIIQPSIKTFVHIKDAINWTESTGSCLDFVDMAGQLSSTALGSPRSVHTGGRWVQIKRLGYAPPRNWDAWGAGKLSAWLALILWFSSVNKAARLMEHVRFLQDLGAGLLLWLDSCQPVRAQRTSGSSMCCWRLQSRRAERGEGWFFKNNWIALAGINLDSVWGCWVKLCSVIFGALFCLGLCVICSQN